MEASPMEASRTDDPPSTPPARPQDPPEPGNELPGPRRRGLRRGIYLLPSIFTISNILLGFYAVVLGLRGDFQRAVVMIFLAAVLDGLDGRIARLTNTDSDFGKEYDSLADVLTFGAAPALLTYLWGLDQLGRIGWLVPLYYLVCAATRLARFNVQTRKTDARWFVGLPVPAAAGAICALLFFAPEQGWKSWSSGVLLASLVAAGSLMVSTFRYWSFKRIDLRRRWSYRIALPLAAALFIILVHPPAFFLVLMVFYAASGPVSWLWGRLRWRGGREAAAEPAPEVHPERT